MHVLPQAPRDTFVQWKQRRTNVSLTAADRMRWCWSFRLAQMQPRTRSSPGLLLQVWVLGERANSGGYCWPSVRQLAFWTALSSRSVQRGLRELVGQGWLQPVTGEEREANLPPRAEDPCNGLEPFPSANMFRLCFPNPDAYEASFPYDPTKGFGWNGSLL